MTSEDLHIITELLSGISIGLNSRVESQYTVIDEKLNGIHTRLDKLNGSVAHHEEQIQEALQERARNRQEQKDFREKVQVEHVLACPNMDRIRKIEDNQLSFSSVRKWIVGSVVATAGIMSIVWILFQMYEKTHP